MKVAAILIVISFTACSTMQHPGADANEGLLVTGFPHLPVDARDIAERFASCSHFFGEIGGDPDRDKEIMGFLAQLRCGSIEKEVAAMRSKYASNKAVQDALDRAGSL